MTRNLCAREKLFIPLDSKQTTALRAADAIVRFLKKHAIEVLNVAGPRASGWPKGYEFALRVIGEVIGRMG
jgi:putative molybdenum carrier protein